MKPVSQLVKAYSTPTPTVHPLRVSLNVAVARITDTAGHRGNRLDFKAIREVRKEGVSSVCMGVGPIIVALDTNHPPAGELLIAADLRTSAHAAGIAAEGPTEDR